MSSKARRPYLMGKESVMEFYQAPVRFLKELTGRESEFEKPYVDEDYRKMHFDFPWPDWPPFPPIPPWPPWIPPDGPVEDLKLCGITCYEPLSDCDEPIWCHPSIWCGRDLNCNLCTWMVEGATTGYTWNKIIGGAPSKTRGIDIWIDKNLLTDGKALIHVQMKDPCGNLCGEDLEVTCKVCPPEIVMTWDSVNSATTIGQGVGAGYATAEVFVKDGLGPFSWSVAGTGFSFENPTTSARQNTLRADDTACGVATVTVTDACDGTAIGYVRCTVGEWCEIAFSSCVISGAITEGDDHTRIEGKYKLYEVWDVCSTVAGAGVSCSYLEGYGSQGCGEAATCHATMGCTKCLAHANGWCRTNEPVLCYVHADFICCSDTEAECSERDCVSMCNKITSKLYEWKCAC